MHHWGVHIDMGDGSFLNGALHWLVFTHDNDDPRIIAFNVMERNISEISQPPRELKYPPHLCHFSKGNGRMFMSLKEYKVQSSWTKLLLFLY